VNDTGKTFYLETLGCPRNESDSEAIINILENSGFGRLDIPEKADFVIVNGCAFIQEAVSESIDMILNLREKNKKATLILVGCMAQRYGEELLGSMGEVDLLLGTGSIEKIAGILNKGESEVSSNLGFLGKNLYKKAHVTPSHYRYIKIQEGCDFKCSFCVIPELKGISHSKEISVVKEEIANLPENVKEIIIVGQNTTSWGKDLPGNFDFRDVIREIAGIFAGWIRLMYFHPLFVSENLLKTIYELPNVVNYLDIPLQHVSDSVLSDMNRGYKKNNIKRLLETVYRTGEFALRSTFIVGFPSETEKDFEELCSFIEDNNIDHIGIFGYSHEEGSSSFSMKPLSQEIISRRIETVSSIIERKMGEKNEGLIGKKRDVLIDGVEEGEYFGRMESSAPDIDPVVWISAPGEELKIGNIYNVSIIDSISADMVGELVL
jgi:ribosomal protein S12 methylthiotransferase